MKCPTAFRSISSWTAFTREVSSKQPNPRTGPPDTARKLDLPAQAIYGIGGGTSKLEQDEFSPPHNSHPEVPADLAPPKRSLGFAKARGGPRRVASGKTVVPGP